jgi:hypothetical protein
LQQALPTIFVGWLLVPAWLLHAMNAMHFTLPGLGTQSCLLSHVQSNRVCWTGQQGLQA